MTTVRLAHMDETPAANALKGGRGVKRIPKESAPALLISYVYSKPWLKHQSEYVYRDWVLDSGAFSAANIGRHIDLHAYIKLCRRLLTTDPTLSEVFSLDVIGDWKGSKRNADIMWKEGVPAIPCFHVGEPWGVLEDMAAQYDKIALGGMVFVPPKKKVAWLDQCFARVWPKKVHGFGVSSERILLRFPFHSVDATNWELSACAFGSWQSLGEISVRGSNQNLRSEVEHFLRLEQKVREKWKSEMATLEQLPTVRLAVSGETPGGDREKSLGGKQPTVRLAAVRSPIRGIGRKDKDEQ